MQLFSFQHEGKNYALTGSSWTGFEQLLVDGQEVSRKWNYRFSGHHEFSLPGLGRLKLDYRLDYRNYRVSYELSNDAGTVLKETGKLEKPAWIERLEIPRIRKIKPSLARRKIKSPGVDILCHLAVWC